MQRKTKAGLTTASAALVLAGVIGYQASASRSTTANKGENFVVASSGERSLSISGGELRMLDRGRRTAVIPADQALIVTESGIVAVIGDEAVPVKGAHEEAEARRMLAVR